VAATASASSAKGAGETKTAAASAATAAEGDGVVHGLALRLRRALSCRCKVAVRCNVPAMRSARPPPPFTAAAAAAAGVANVMESGEDAPCKSLHDTRQGVAPGRLVAVAVCGAAAAAALGVALGVWRSAEGATTRTTLGGEAPSSRRNSGLARQTAAA